jgi:hypothetical protein
VTWHAHCISPECNSVDRDNGYTADTLPEVWTCPECGGTAHEFVESGYDPAQAIQDLWGESR